MSDFTLVTDMDRLRARRYFCEAKHYVGFELPPYFQFDQILLSASAIMNRRQLSEICVRKGSSTRADYPSSYADVNHVILSNKDGGFAWRPMHIIHPVLYIDLVNTITTESGWSEIQELFNRQKTSCVDCISLPLESNVSETNRAVMVTNWWEKIEQESLRRSLDYKFMFTTDIANCYPSIYTHSLEWAFCAGGRLEVKRKRARNETTRNLGSEIDSRLQNMNQGQTAGIPQGSELMNFVAEMVLAGADIELSERIANEMQGCGQLKIVRYRDDYRIFSTDYTDGHRVMKLLNEVLHAWNMKMNASKTSETADIILSAIKPEKLEEIYTAPTRQSYQKEAVRIYQLSKKYPNSGLVAKSLTLFYDRLIKYGKKSKNIDFEVIVAIMTMTARFSPKYMPQAAAIITTIIEMSNAKLDRKGVITRIIDNFKDVPNTQFIDVWLQRITSPDDIRSYAFDSTITKVATGDKDNSALWNSDWLNETDRATINTVSITDLPNAINSGVFNPLIGRKEFELYKRDYE